MSQEQRMGERHRLKEPCTIRYTDYDGETLTHDVNVLDLSSSALALRIPRDDEVTHNYSELINGPALLKHPHWAEDPEMAVWRRGFLSIARRLNSEYWKWVFFFDRKYPV